MAGKTISTSETRIEALQLQSSSYGVVIPLVFGVARVAGNLVWQGGFKAIPHTTEQGGKGGGVKARNTTFTYVASVIMGLAHGPIAAIPRIWRGKKLYSGGLSPSQLLTASESYAVPGSGAMTYALIHGATFVAVSAVTTPADWGDGPFERLLVEGTHYAVAAGALTVLDDALRGATLLVVYQYTTGSVSYAALDDLALTLKSGAIAQAAWGGLAGFAAESLGYSGLAYVAGQDYDLGSNAQVENHNFEVIGPLAYHLGATVPDVDPALMLRTLMTDARAGGGFPSGSLDDWSAWSDQCVASGLLVSPALTEQTSMAEIIRTAAELTNAAPVWSGARLKMVPYGDSAETGNGRTYTPASTPVYALDDDCYVPASADDPPVRVSLKAPVDRFNHVRVEFLNRANQYAVEIAEARDETDVAANGLRSKPIMRAHWICDAAVARRVAQVVMQRSLSVCAEYSFMLPWHFALLEPADLITLADSTLQLAGDAARVTVIEELEDGDLAVTAEEYPAGTASAALYPSQVGAGYAADYNAAPGDVAAPVFFELPVEIAAENGLQVGIAVRGGGSNWGGCQVWVSVDGTSYRQIDTVYGGSRYGSLAASVTNVATSVQVQGLGSSQLLAGSADDAAALSTLCFIGGASPEFIVYQGATLTGVGAYTLGTLGRGVYGVAAAAHAAGAPFVRVDRAIARSQALDLSYIGKTLHFKFLSFNLFGEAVQSLADVAEHTYTVAGYMVAARAAKAGNRVFFQTGAPSGALEAGDLWFDTDDGNKPYSYVAGSGWLAKPLDTAALEPEAATKVLSSSAAGPWDEIATILGTTITPGVGEKVIVTVSGTISCSNTSGATKFVWTRLSVYDGSTLYDTKTLRQHLLNGQSISLPVTAQFHFDALTAGSPVTFSLRYSDRADTELPSSLSDASIRVERLKR